jgi:hypothetical protein
MGRGERWLLAWAVAYGTGHHLGLLPAAAAGGGTRWTDWLDLLVPYAVVGTALAALAAAGTDRRGWTVAAAGAVLYTQGHGIHLAANSISNGRGDAPPAHLWDEVVGHLLWYGGLALLVAVLARAFPGLRAGRRAAVLAVLTGVTWATNALGADGLAAAGLAGALALAGYGWTLRSSGAGRLLMLAFLPAAAIVAAGWVSAA